MSGGGYALARPANVWHRWGTEHQQSTFYSYIIIVFVSG